MPLILTFGRLQFPLAPACFSLHASVFDPAGGLVLAEVAGSGSSVTSPAVIEWEGMSGP